MAIDFETIKKIDANGINVGMIRDSTGNILWRKKYDKLSLGTKHWIDEGAWDYSQIRLYSPQNVFTGSNVAANNYFWYNDRVDMFTPVNIDAKLFVTWYENAPQLSNTSLLDALPVTCTASAAVQFNYPVYCPGVKELGRIENQDSKFQGAANDSTACVMYGDNKHTLSYITQEDAVEVWNKYFALDRIQSTKPTDGLTDYIGCSVMPKINVGSGQNGYSVLFTLHMYSSTRSNQSAVSFFIVDNTEDSAKKTPRLITLSTGENQQTVILHSSSEVNFDILNSNSYANSSFSYAGGGKFTTISGIGTEYFTLKLTDASVKSFHLVANSDASGEIANDNYGTASSCSYCTISFKRLAAQYTGLRIHYRQDSESSFDYGIFSKINKPLCPYPIADSTITSGNRKIFNGYGSEVVQHSCKNESGDNNVVAYDISSLDLNTPYRINVKYIKDASYDGGHDTLAITKIEFVEDVYYSFSYDATNSNYCLTVGNTSSTDIPFEWLYIYIDCSSEVYTLADAPQIRYTIPAGDEYTLPLTHEPMLEQSGRIFCIFKCNGQYHTIYQ